MRFTSSIKHAGKQFFRNKSRAVTLMFGIIISITLISGILYATDSLTTYSIETNLKQTPFDITVDSNATFASVKSGWDSIVSNNSNYLKEMYATTAGVFVSNPTTSDGQGGQGGPGGTTSNTLLETQRGAALKLNGTANATVSDAANYTSVLAANISLLTYLNESKIVNFGSFNQTSLNDGEIIIDSTTAITEGISVNDTVNLFTFWSDNSTLEVSNLIVVGIIQILDTTKLFEGFNPSNLENGSTAGRTTFPGGSGNFGVTFNPSGIASRVVASIRTDSSFIFANLDFGRQIIVNASASDPSVITAIMQYRYIFQLNVAALPIYSTSDLSTTMAYIENQIQLGTGITSTLTDYITTAISSIQSDLTFFELISLLVSVPAIVLGVYLTMVLYNLALEQRRREFGILKSRGASSKDVAKIYLLEAMFIAVVGGLVGSLLGMGISYAIISQILGSSFTSFLAIVPFSINWIYVLAAVGFAIALTLIASTRPIKTYSQLSVVEYVAYYNEALATKQKKSRVEWVALVLGLTPLILLIVTDILSATSSPTSSSNFSRAVGGMSGGGFGVSGIGTVLYSILSEIGSALTWFSPVLLTYALVKIVIGRSPDRFARISRKISSVFSKKTSYLVATNIMRNPKRSTQIVTIIAITICFGIIAQIIEQSQSTFEYNQIYMTVGADIRVTGTNTGYALQSQIQAVSSDITNITTVAAVSGTVGSSITESIRVVGLNATPLVQAVDLQSDYFYGVTPQTTISTLAATTNGALLSETLATSLGLSTGSSLTISFSNTTATMTLGVTVVGYMQALPGVSSTTTGSSGYIYVNYELLNDTVLPYLSSVSYIYLARIAANPTNTSAQIESIIKSTLGTSISSVTTLAEEEAAYNAKTTVYQNVVTLMSFQFPFLLVMASFGIMMVTILSLVEKQREMALIRVKGVTEKQQIKVQLAEGFVLILIGLIVGAALGFPLAYLTNIQLDSLDTRSTTLGLSRPFVIPIGSIILILGLVPLLFFGIILLTSYLEGRKSRIGPITDILRSY